jgi:hypothetical protein
VIDQLSVKVAARFAEAVSKEAASAAGKDMELAWAYADAWPKQTLFDPRLRFEIYQRVKEFAPHAYDTATSRQQDLKRVWENVSLQVRNLHYRSHQWLSPQQYIELMTDICPRYNGFAIRKVAAGLLDPDAKGIKVQAARELSPALYIKGEPDVLDWFRMQTGPDIMKADEATIQGDMLRLWWD